MSLGPSTTARDEWKSAWRVVVGGSIGMGTGVGLYAMVGGLFVRPLQDEFGWGRGDIAAAGLLALLAAFLFPLLGKVVDRFGSRRVASVGMLALTFVYISLSKLTGSLYAFYVTMAGIAFLGPLTSPVVITRAVNTWFQKSRGLAIGITMTGVSFTAAIALPVLAWVISDFGWREAFWVLAAVALLIGLPAVATLLRDRRKSDIATIQSAAAGPVAADSTLKLSLRDLRFWLLAIAMLAANLPIGGLLSQLQPLLLDKGFSSGTAALLGSVFAVGIAVGRVGTGALLDRYWAPAVAAMVLACPIVGVAILLPDHLAHLAVGALAAFSFGLAQGAEGDFVAYLVPRYFGMTSYGAIFGSLVMCVSVSLSLGAVLFGIAHDKTGDYSIALKAAVPLYLIGAICVLGSGLIDRRRSRN